MPALAAALQAGQRGLPPLQPWGSRYKQTATGETLTFHPDAPLALLPAWQLGGSYPADPIEAELQQLSGKAAALDGPAQGVSGGLRLGATLHVQPGEAHVAGSSGAAAADGVLWCVDGSGVRVGCLQVAELRQQAAGGGTAATEGGGRGADWLQQLLESSPGKDGSGGWLAEVRSIRFAPPAAAAAADAAADNGCRVIERVRVRLRAVPAAC